MSALLHRPRFLRGTRIASPIDAPVVHTERLTLRPHRPADADDWFRMQSDPEVVRYLPWPLRDRKASIRHLHVRLRQTRLWQSNDFLALAVELDGRMIGEVSLHLRTVNPASRTAEVSWIIASEYGRRGYGTEAAHAIVHLAFTELRAKAVLAVVDVGNEASFALARRLGFEPAGREGRLASLVLTAAAHAAVHPPTAPSIRRPADEPLRGAAPAGRPPRDDDAGFDPLDPDLDRPADVRAAVDLDPR